VLQYWIGIIPLSIRVLLIGGHPSLWPHQEFVCLENTPLRRRSGVHPGGGHQALHRMGLLGFMLGILALARGCLGCDNLLAGGS
jgi:hypothetical protein